MVDRCEVWRDPGGATDDTTDPVTGEVVTLEQILLFTSDCGIKPTYRNLGEVVGGQPKVIGFYDLKVPMSKPACKPGDQVKMITGVHDPRVVGKWFRIEEVLHSTLALFAKYRVELRERIDDRP